MRVLKLLLILIAGCAAVAAPAKPPLVLAAASLQESLGAAAEAWATRGHEKPVIAFAGSSALARQIAAGAPADLFISADEAWMDDVARRGLIVTRSRVSFLGNSLVLVAPAASRQAPIAIGSGLDLAAALGRDGRLAMADPQAVPAGKYGKAALLRLGAWPRVGPRVASAENVRAALALVARGEAPLGIVYATDARAAKGVKVVGTFPAASHPPITYPIALLKTATSRDAAAFERFLLSKPGRAIFVRYGFVSR